MISKEELHWILRAQCGDREALEALLRSAQPRLRQYLRRLVGAQQADDILQDALLAICRNLPGLKMPELFGAWTLRIASRLAFRQLRRERGRPEQAVDPADIDAVAAPAPPPSAEMLERLLGSGSLPPASRAVLELHFGQELSLAEVAAILDIPLGTVKSRLAAGLAALRHQMQERSL